MRKQIRSNNPGVIVVIMENENHKKDVLKAKKDLVRVRQFRDVFIEDDIPYEERRNDANLATSLREVGKSDSLSVHRSRMVHRTRGNRGGTCNRGHEQSTTNETRRRSTKNNTQHRETNANRDNGRYENKQTRDGRQNNN